MLDHRPGSVPLSSIVKLRKFFEKMTPAQRMNEVGACYSATVGEGASRQVWKCSLGSMGKNGTEDSNGRIWCY